MKIVSGAALPVCATRPTTLDPVHQAALAALPTKDARVVYACQELAAVGLEVYPRDVIEWLAAYGVDAKRQRTSKILNAWKRGDTRPLPTEATGDIEDDTADLPELDEATQAGLALIHTPADLPPRTPAGEAMGDGAIPRGDITRQATPDPAASPRRPVAVWPLYLLALPAMVAIWAGWVTLGGLTGFGVVHPLPGIWNNATVDTSITLPIGVEVYAGYALHIWLHNRVAGKARRFAKWSAIASLALGMAGQVAVHLMAAAHVTVAPWQITTIVSCLPVAVLGMGVALAALVRAEQATGRE